MGLGFCTTGTGTGTGSSSSWSDIRRRGPFTDKFRTFNVHTRCNVSSGQHFSNDKDENNVPVNRRRIQGPPIETKPNYNEIHGPLGKFLDSLFLQIFRSKMESITNISSPLPKDNYQGLMDVATQMNRQYSKKEVRMLSREILKRLFLPWLPSAFSWMFAGPFPEFSARMNAYATYVAGQWLMGECEMMDSKTDQGIEKKTNHGLLVKRCRFLEESGCASVCVNACKLPTQDFFNQDMGLPLTMTPNYETFECEFKFCLSVNETEEALLLNTPCLGRCSLAATAAVSSSSSTNSIGKNNDSGAYKALPHRENVNNNNNTHRNNKIIEDDQMCHFMIDESCD